VSDRVATIHCGEALAVLRTLPDTMADACVTSPPYWRMRDYGHADQLGMELDVDDFIARLATIFDEVARVLKPTGTCWVNLGDSYNVRGGGRTQGQLRRRYMGTPRKQSPGLKNGDLAMVPARFALECQRRGWWVRQEIAWHKPNAIPDVQESRPSRTHEHLFLLTRAESGKYYYAPDAVLLPLSPTSLRVGAAGYERSATPEDGTSRIRSADYAKSMPVRRTRTDADGNPLGSRVGSVWTIAVRSNRERVEHFAMQADEVARRCILLGCPPEGIVLDPFVGAGTTAIMARRLGRSCIGIELVPATAELARERVLDDEPLTAMLEAPSATMPATLGLFETDEVPQ
jgi:DNA modification methylase